MAITVSVYNHTARLFQSGVNPPSSTYKLMICSAATFNAADTTLAGVTKTEVSGNGYTAGGATLANVAVTTANTNGSKFTADNVAITASGGTLSGSFGILYNNTASGSPPLAFIDFGGTISATAGTQFQVNWNAAGIFPMAVA